LRINIAVPAMAAKPQFSIIILHLRPQVALVALLDFELLKTDLAKRQKQQFYKI